MSYEITQECLSAYLIRLREEEKSSCTKEHTEYIQ